MDSDSSLLSVTIYLHLCAYTYGGVVVFINDDDDIRSCI